MKCDTVTESREQCRTIYVDKIEQVPRKTCNNVMVEKCEPYNVPSTVVVTENKEGTQTFGNIKTCEIATQPAQHCARLPTKEICQPRKVTRRVKKDNYNSQCEQVPPEHGVGAVERGIV